ncbi:MAG: tetratricopeptide repeat protein [Phycisphaerae bacterium]
MRSTPFMLDAARVGSSLTVSLLLSVAGFAAPGCASKPNTRADLAGQSSRRDDPLDPLRRLAAAQELRPDRQAVATPPPASLLRPSAAGDSERRDISLEQAIKALTPPAPSPAPAPAQPPSASESIESSKFYVSGRSHLLAGRINEALVDLEAAARLDPGSASILSDLAQAQAASGRRPAATATYRRAVSLGLRDARVAAFLGRETLRSRQFEQAAGELILADSLSKEQGAALTRAVARADLADALFNLGYIRAAAESLTDLLGTLPTDVRGPLRPEEAELFRRRSELWLRAGDLHASRGDMAEAGIAYAAAAALPGGDSEALTQRRLYALLASGRSAQAAIDLIESLRGRGPKALQGQFDLLGSLVRQSSIGPEIVDACAAVACEPGSTLLPSVKHDLVIAAAEAASPADARRALGAWMRCSSEPLRGAAMYAALHGDDAAACAQAFASLCVARPHCAPGFADALVQSGRHVRGVIAWCRDRSTDPGAWLLLQCLTAPLPASSHPFTAAPRTTEPDAARVVIAATRARRGMWSEVDTALEALAACDRPELKASALAAAQRLGEAAATARGASGVQEGMRVTGITGITGLTVASWLLEIGDAAQAETVLRACLDADPLDERAYEALISQYSPRAPLADESKLTEIAGRLRDNIPASRFAKGVAARDLASRSQWTAATDALLGLLQPHEESATVLAMLVAVGERARVTDAKSLARIEAVIDDRLRGRPDAPELVMAKARLLACQPGRAAEAESLLAEAWQRLPLPATARLRESIVREVMQEPERAASMARERLMTGPRGLDESIEFAQLLATAGEYDAAGRAITEGLPQRVPLTSSQSSRLVGLAAELRPERMVESDATASAAALALFDQVAARGLTMTPAMHMTRLLLLCAAASSDPARLTAAVAEAAGRDLQVSMQLSVRVAQLLLSKPDPSDGLAFLLETINLAPEGQEETVFAYELFRVTITRGDAADVDACVDRIRDPGSMLRAVSATIDNDEVRVPADEQARRAELAYWLGNGLSVEQREGVSEHAYRLAIRLDPSHAWALNNLGFNLLERGGNSMQEAASMIERAFAKLPDEPSVIDSMGWLRYRQGRFDDRTLPDGKVEAGAGSILARAVNHPGGTPSAEQSDHFGDVLWRLGRHKEAQAQWDTAKRLLDSQLALHKGARDDSQQPRPLEKFLGARVEAIAAKLAAAANGQSPKVAPTDAESRESGGH